MSSTTQLIEEPFVYRTDFSSEALSIESSRKKEKRFVPSALVPHTVEIGNDSGWVEIEFDYTIDEMQDREIILAKDFRVIRGRFTKKIISVRFLCSPGSNLPSRLGELIGALKKHQVVEGSSAHRNYPLVIDALSEIQADYLTDSELRSLFDVNGAPVAAVA